MANVTHFNEAPIRRAGRRALVGAAALVLATAAGLATWQVGLHARSSARVAPLTQAGPTAKLAPSVAVTVMPQVAAASAESPATTQSVQYAGGRSAGPTLYLTGSATEATTIQAELDDATVVFLGGRPSENAVTVVAPGDEALVQRNVDDLNRIRASLGLPEITIVDLRTPVSTNSTSPAQRAIADENSLRASLGLPELVLPGSERQATAPAVSRLPSTSVAASAPTPPSVAALAPLVVYLVTSEEQRLLVDAFLQRAGLHTVAALMHAPDDAERFRLPGLEFASGEQWNTVAAAILQQQVEAGQQAITRALAGR